jgi:ribonuclease HI
VNWSPAALARRTGCPPEQALRQTLEAKAGTGTLAQLVAERGYGATPRPRTIARDVERAAAGARKLRHDGPLTAWRAWLTAPRIRIRQLRHRRPAHRPGRRAHRDARAAGYGNSSEAEYRALIALLEAAAQAGAHGLTIYGDSKVVIDDLNGSDATAAPSLNELRQAALALTAQLRGFSLRWIPRHKNSAADALSQRARSEPASSDIKE